MATKTSYKSTLVRFAVVIAILCSASLHAQTPPPYGAPITLEEAKKPAAAALAEAARNKWTMAVAIVDPGGNLVYFEKMDNTQLGSINIAIDKARTAALYKRPTKALQDALAAGGAGLLILGVRDATPVAGGNPLIEDGKIVGAIGVSGDAPEHDDQCSLAGAVLVK